MFSPICQRFRSSHMLNLWHRLRIAVKPRFTLELRLIFILSLRLWLSTRGTHGSLGRVESSVSAIYDNCNMEI